MEILKRSNIKNIDNTFENMNKFKTTYFYKEFVGKVFICNDTPGVVWFLAKKPYGKRDEIALINELEDMNASFDVKDISFCTSEVLKEA